METNPDVQAARQALAQVDELRRRTRSALASAWYPLVVFGLITVLSAGVPLVAHEALVGAYWLVVGGAGSALVARHYRRREDEIGLAEPWVPYALVGVAIFVACLGLGFFGSGDVRVAGPPLAVAAGYLVLATLDRCLSLGLLAVGMAVVVLAVLAVDPGHPYSVQSLVIGAGTVGVGLALRRAEQAERAERTGR